MVTNIFTFMAGAFVGVFVGVLIMCMMVAASKGER